MSLKILAKQTAIYGLSTIVLRLASWLLAPYYSRVIERVDIGINGDLLAMAAFINVIYMMGMETSYFRFIKKLDEKEIAKRAIKGIELGQKAYVKAFKNSHKNQSKS